MVARKSLLSVKAFLDSTKDHDSKRNPYVRIIEVTHVLR